MAIPVPDGYGHEVNATEIANDERCPMVSLCNNS